MPHPVPEAEPDGDLIGQQDSETEPTEEEQAAAEEQKRAEFSDYGIFVLNITKSSLQALHKKSQSLKTQKFQRQLTLVCSTT